MRFVLKILLPLIAALSLSAFIHKTTPEEKFWKWFSSKSDQYYEHLDDRQDAIFSEIGTQLRKIHPDLTFQFSIPDKEGKREFVISADGKKAAISSVLKLVEQVPKLDKWRIIAFRQRETDFPVVQFEGLTLSVEEIYFHAKDEGDKTGLILYIRGYNGTEKYMGAAFILLDNNIGEFDVMTRIGSLEFRPLDKNLSSELKPFKELAPLIDSKKTIN